MCFDIDKLNRELSWINHEVYEPIPTRLEEALFDDAKTDYFHTGNEIMENLREDERLIDQTWKTRSRIQKRVHHEMFSTVAPFVYKSSYKSHLKAILEHNNFEKCLSGIFMKMPRRGGKTEAAAQGCAMIMKNLPNSIISIIAPGGRQAKGKGSIKSLILEILQSCLKLNVRNTDECILYELPGGDQRKIFALPGGSPNTYVLLSCLLFFSGKRQIVFIVFSLSLPLLVDSTNNNALCFAFPILTPIDVDVCSRHSCSLQHSNESNSTTILNPQCLHDTLTGPFFGFKNTNSYSSSSSHEFSWINNCVRSNLFFFT